MTKGSEFDIIDRYFKPLTSGDTAALGLSDDAALLDVPNGQQLVVTSDALVSGVHFLNDQSPQDIAHKVVGVNLSDLAAMGAKPRAVFLAAQFPKNTPQDWIAAFAKGFGEALKPSGAVLLGGDTVGTAGPMAFTLTALGYVPKSKALKRSGASVGDALYVSGTIGDAALGLLCSTQKLAPNAHLMTRYARPEPRLALGQALADSGLATACIDISDGLVADVAHICETSELNATLEADAVPRSKAAQFYLDQTPDLLGLILNGGDDYELAFTVKPEHILQVESLSAELKSPISKIGVMDTNGTRVRVLDLDGQVIDITQEGYKHL